MAKRFEDALRQSEAKRRQIEEEAEALFSDIRSLYDSAKQENLTARFSADVIRNLDNFINIGSGKNCNLSAKELQDRLNAMQAILPRLGAEIRRAQKERLEAEIQQMEATREMRKALFGSLYWVCGVILAVADIALINNKEIWGWGLVLVVVSYGLADALFGFNIFILGCIYALVLFGLVRLGDAFSDGSDGLGVFAGIVLWGPGLIYYFREMYSKIH